MCASAACPRFDTLAHVEVLIPEYSRRTWHFSTCVKCCIMCEVLYSVRKFPVQTFQGCSSAPGWDWLHGVSDLRVKYASMHGGQVALLGLFLIPAIETPGQDFSEVVRDNFRWSKCHPKGFQGLAVLVSFQAILACMVSGVSTAGIGVTPQDF